MHLQRNENYQGFQVMANKPNWVKGIVKGAWPAYVQRDQPPGWKVGDRWRVLECQANLNIELPKSPYTTYPEGCFAESKIIGSFAQFTRVGPNHLLQRITDDNSLRWLRGFELEVNIKHRRFKKPGFMPGEAIRFTIDDIETHLAYHLLMVSE